MIEKLDVEKKLLAHRDRQKRPGDGCGKDQGKS